jgi:glycosyltransferase involved in cell wall biosynthesis
MLNNLRDYWTIKFSRLFDPVYYLLNYPDVRNADIDPLIHFIEHGWREGRNPSQLFDTNYYLNMNPDVKKSGLNPLFHYVLYGKKERREINPFKTQHMASDTEFSIKPRKNISFLTIRKKIYRLFYSIYKSLPAFMREKVHRSAKKIAPKVLSDYRNIGRQILNEYDDFGPVWRRTAMNKFLSSIEQQSQNTKPIKYFFTLPLFSTGGAELVAMNFIRLILESDKDSNVLLIITDMDKMEMNYSLPPELITINLEKFLGTKDFVKKKVFVYDLVTTLKPTLIHNINSSVFWSILLEKGERIKKISKIFANIFCFQFNPEGSRDGYAEYYLREAIPYLDGLISDNKRFIDDAISEYRLQSSSDKLFPIYTPSNELNDITISFAKDRIAWHSKNEHPIKRMRCLWAGRLDEQKRWKLFLDIVEKCDFCDFDMFGQAVMGTNPMIQKLPNLYFYGSFESFSQILQNKDYDAFLFTSQWEGLPTTLLGVGSWGIPIIAPSVGGVSELVNSETGYLLPEKPTVNDYSSALEEINDNPNEASRRANNMLNLIMERHNWFKFSNDVHNVPGYFD